MYEQADHSLAISFEEITYLKHYISQPIHYIPPYFFEVEKETPSFDERDGMLFIGGFNHTPNQDAMLWFLKDIYEPLHQQGIKLTIVGSNVPTFIYEYKKQFKLLEIVSNISTPNLNALYSKIKLSIVPLRVGAGVKGKVIEAMSKGVPVAGTFLAFEGIPKDDDFPYVGYNYPNELIDNILHLHSNKDAWNKYSSYGKQYVTEHFNKDIMKQIFSKLV